MIVEMYHKYLMSSEAVNKQQCHHFFLNNRYRVLQASAVRPGRTALTAIQDVVPFVFTVDRSNLSSFDVHRS